MVSSFESQASASASGRHGRGGPRHGPSHGPAHSPSESPTHGPSGALCGTGRIRRSAGCGKVHAGGRLILPVVGPWADWENPAPKALDWLEAVAIPLAVTIAVCLIAVWVIGRIRIRHHLRRRVSYDLLPATSFEAKPEEILRFAAQLARTRPQASRLIPRRAASVRIRWYTDDDGLLRMRVEGPANAASVLRHRTYPDVEIRQPSPVGRPGETTPGEDSPPGAGGDVSDRGRPG